MIPFERLVVVGLGLLGGSVARGARARGLARRIVAVGRPGSAGPAAQAAGVVDHATTDLREGLAGADLVILATPVGTLPAYVRDAWPHLAPGAVLTDVGSVKRGIVEAADACPARPGVAFVGGHPMAGSERSGFGAADPDLFEGRLTLLTPSERSGTAAVERVAAFWKALGCEVRLLSVESHDRGVAQISHLPHLVAYALVRAAERSSLALAGRGFTDTTRIAASAESLWVDIFRENREALLAALARHRASLDRWEGLIRSGAWGDLEADLRLAREARESLR